jgi:hypothetical protein
MAIIGFIVVASFAFVTLILGLCALMMSYSFEDLLLVGIISLAISFFLFYYSYHHSPFVVSIAS